MSDRKSAEMEIFHMEGRHQRATHIIHLYLKLRLYYLKSHLLAHLCIEYFGEAFLIILLNYYFFFYVIWFI